MIAVLLIASGKYEQYINNLVNSINEKFMLNHEKRIIVFTDSDLEYNGIIKIKCQKKGWPYDTMMRFDLFSTHQNSYNDCEYVVYLDSDMIIVDEVKDNILKDMFGVVHPGFFYHRGLGDFETNTNSTACITPDIIRNIFYFQGCFFGGKFGNFFNLVEYCRENQNKDFSNGIIARWHDESHLNKYFSINKPFPIDPGYAYPENWNIPFKKRIIHLAKNHSDMRK